MSILKIGISSRALFDLGESHEIFKKEGIEEYSNYQKKNENKPLDKLSLIHISEPTRRS